MRETAVESHPFGFAQSRLFSQSARKRMGHPAVQREEAGRGRPVLHKLGLEAEASAQREDAASKSTGNRAEV